MQQGTVWKEPKQQGPQNAEAENEVYAMKLKSDQEKHRSHYAKLVNTSNNGEVLSLAMMTIHTLKKQTSQYWLQADCTTTGPGPIKLHRL